MKIQPFILPALASLLMFGAACGKASKKAPEEETAITPAAPTTPSTTTEQNPPAALEPVVSTTPANSANMKMVGLRFGSEYLTLKNEKIYNVDAQGHIQSEVLEVKQSTADAKDIRETPVVARPRRIDSLNEEFFLLLQPEYNTCNFGACEWSRPIHPQNNYLVNKKNGDAWEIDSTFMPVPGSVKFVENDQQKTVFFLAHDARDNSFLDFYTYNEHYASESKEKLFVYGRKVLVAIDISRPDQKILQPISGNLNVKDYEVDRNGNAIVRSTALNYSESTYLIARNGTQPVISLVQDPEFKLKVDSSYIFRDEAGNLYRYSMDKTAYSLARIAKLEVTLEEGRAVTRTIKEISVPVSNRYGSDTAVLREDKDTLYFAIKGDLIILKKDLSEAKNLAFSANNYLADLYLEILPEQNKAFVVGRDNQIIVATQIDLAKDTVKSVDIAAIEGKVANFQKKGNALELTTLDEATDTTIIYTFDTIQEKFKLTEKKPGQIDDTLRILVKVSGSVTQ